jgi:uncharacterized SAM-binding protein YcdF (DUF218 family)
LFVLIGKIFASLVYPLGIAVILWATALICRWRRQHRLARRLVLAGVFLVLYFSQPWVADALTRSLEDDYPLRPAQELPRADAIVVLGGATGAPVPPRIDVDVGGAFDRLLFGMRLLRANKADYIILSGGVIASIVGSDMTEARRLRRLALEYGVADRAILLEEQSRSTRENALFTAQLLRQRQWQRVLLVTSARHMPRAAASFIREGIQVIPAPTDLIAVQRPLTIGRFLPNAEALRESHKAVKEYVGYVVYWLRGWV